jgi:hypothetical protein
MGTPSSRQQRRCGCKRKQATSSSLAPCHDTGSVWLPLLPHWISRIGQAHIMQSLGTNNDFWHRGCCSCLPCSCIVGTPCDQTSIVTPWARPAPWSNGPASACDNRRIAIMRVVGSFNFLHSQSQHTPLTAPCAGALLFARDSTAHC